MAQFVGLLFSTTSFGFYLGGYKVVALWVLATLFTFTMLQGVYNLCAACLLFYILSLMGLIPKNVLEKSVQKFAIREYEDEEDNQTLQACQLKPKTSNSSNTADSLNSTSDSNIEMKLEVKVDSKVDIKQEQEKS